MTPSQGDSQALAARMQRLHELRSAWSALATSARPSAASDIAGTGRTLRMQLTALATTEDTEDASDELEAIDRKLSEFSHAIRKIALDLKVAQLRSTLPGLVGSNRRSVLDLLDLLVSDIDFERRDFSDRIAKIDYLITLLCVEGSGRAIRHDPATLSPIMHSLSQRADVASTLDLEGVEGEFFTAAALDAEGLQSELELRTMRRRKGELGLSFFSARALRAIVTYNAALLTRFVDQAWDSRDWGEAEPLDAGAAVGSTENADCASVFDSLALRELAEALRRRAADEAPEPGPVDRVAWSLDLAGLQDEDAAAALAPGVGSENDLAGTAVVVGLLLHSIDALEEELPNMGLSAEQIRREWVPELSRLFKSEVNRLIASEDSYDDACALSDLKNRCLATNSEAQRPAEPATSVGQDGDGAAALNESSCESAEAEAEAQAEAEADRPLDPQEVQRTANDLARDALAETAKPRSGRTGKNKVIRIAQPGESTLRRRFSAQALRNAAAAASIALMLVMLANAFGGGDLKRISRNELERISPYLSEGRRNEDGKGYAFVGTIDAAAWTKLDSAAKSRAAIDLVASLRARGVHDVMIYDDDRQLRIQALRNQAVRLPGA